MKSDGDVPEGASLFLWYKVWCAFEWRNKDV